MSLIEELNRIAAPLDGLRGGQDRFGPVEVLVLGYGYLSVRRGCTTGYEVTVWEDDVTLAHGRTADLAEIASVILDQRERLRVAELCRRHDFLSRDDTTEALWHLLIEHGEPYLAPLVGEAKEVPVLRGLRPWIGHGTLHLLHHSDRIGTADRRGVGFHPTGDGLFKVAAYDDKQGPAEPISFAVLRAAAAAERWG